MEVTTDPARFDRHYQDAWAWPPQWDDPVPELHNDTEIVSGTHFRNSLGEHAVIGITREADEVLSMPFRTIKDQAEWIVADADCYR